LVAILLVYVYYNLGTYIFNIGEIWRSF
jgi:hypothetical protein